MTQMLWLILGYCCLCWVSSFIVVRAVARKHPDQHKSPECDNGEVFVLLSPIHGPFVLFFYGLEWLGEYFLSGKEEGPPSDDTPGD